MKRLVVLLLFFAALFALEEPPIDDVLSYNKDLAPKLANFVLASEIEPMSFSNPIGYAKMELLSIDPSVDDRIDSKGKHYLIWTWGELHGDRFERIVGSGCGGHKNRDILKASGEVKINATIEFAFKGRTEKIETLDTYVLVPFDYSILDRTDGDDRLRVKLYGRMEFPYKLIKERWHEECEEDENGDEHCHCEKDTSVSEKVFVKEFYDSLSYRVEGGNVLFFTFMPPIAEQWKKNNHINTLIFSKRKFYRFIFYMDGGEIARRQLYTFYTTFDKFGVEHIHSEYTPYGEGESEEREERTTPYLIEERPESFCYIYRVDFPHYNAFGLHSLTLLAKDHFLGEHTYSRAVMHREHSVGNYSGDTFYRPSISESFGHVSFSPLIFPVLFVILILAIIWQ